MTIPLFDNDAMLAPLRETLVGRLAAVARAGRYILGPEVEGFEREFAEYLGVRHVIGVANGTDALSISLRSLGVGRDDEVVVPSFTFYASAEAIASIGARPVFCDVDVGTRNVTLETVRAAMTPAVKAIVAVDLFGVPAPIPELRELGVPVVEDAAQAAGASLDGRRAGALGDLATFSFYPSKNLPCLGDGGAVATDDDRLAELVRALRFHGSRDKQAFEYVGYNSRLDELQAAVLRVLLAELDRWSEGRRAVGAAYEAAGLDEHVGLPQTGGPDILAAWHLYVITHERADQLSSGLLSRGVQSRGYYRRPLHLQPAMAQFSPGEGALPATEELARTNLALPMGPSLGVPAIEQVVAAVAGACRAIG